METRSKVKVIPAGWSAGAEGLLSPESHSEVREVEGGPGRSPRAPNPLLCFVRPADGLGEGVRGGRSRCVVWITGNGGTSAVELGEMEGE